MSKFNQVGNWTRNSFVWLRRPKRPTVIGECMALQGLPFTAQTYGVPTPLIQLANSYNGHMLPPSIVAILARVPWRFGFVGVDRH